MVETIYLTKPFIRFFGPSWFTTGWVKMRSIHPVHSEETITLRRAVIGETRDIEGTRLELEIWVADAAGKMTTAGWANARVRVR